MHFRVSIAVAAIWLVTIQATFAASSVERIRNPQVLVTEDTLAPGEQEAIPGKLPSMIVYMSAGTVQISPASGASHTDSVKPGETVFQAAKKGALKNAGASALHFVRIEFLGAGSWRVRRARCSMFWTMAQRATHPRWRPTRFEPPSRPQRQRAVAPSMCLRASTFQAPSNYSAT